MNDKSCYFSQPQLFRMPKSFRTPTPPGLGAFQEDTLVKALPFIAGGIALVVGFNIFRAMKKGKR